MVRKGSKKVRTGCITCKSALSVVVIGFPARFPNTFYTNVEGLSVARIEGQKKCGLDTF
ncbi:hypothetical protein ACKLNR_015453 [Fusarium oxysporum f. sp. zingiberi]